MRRAILLMLSTAVAFASLSAWADGDARTAVRTRPGPLDERREVARPRIADLPDDLRVRVVVVEERETDDREVATRPPRSDVRSRTVVTEAVSAARAAATDAVRRSGLREYYRAGWHGGMRRALDDPDLGRWDYEQGVRAGSRDPQARRHGLDEGASRASIDAARAAEDDVEAQFLDLARDPVRAPTPAPVAWRAEGRWREAASLEVVFERYPVREVDFLDARAEEAFRGWTYDPWELSRRASHRDFFDGHWSDAAAAFDRWVDRRPNERRWRSLDGDERAAFRERFDAAFARAIAIEHGPALERAYADGWADGWDYGAFVVYEEAWDRGFAEGFNRAVASASADGYARAFSTAYLDAYDAAFDRWAVAAVPGIVSVEAFDGNDDGVFEPGESVLVEVRAVNYGGGRGTFALAVDGERLAGPAGTEVVFRGRGEAGDVRPVRVVVSPDAPLRSRVAIRASLGDAGAETTVRIGRPLELAGRVGLDADALAGRARVEVEVVNRSRRVVAGAVRAVRADGQGAPSYAIEPLAAGAARTVAFEFDRIRPADLVGGTFVLRFVVEAEGVLQDEKDWRAPDRASDLASRDFERWVESLATAAAASPDDLDAARALAARRLAADWREAVRGRGNPYKTDLRRGTATTAVGELVRLRERVGGRANPAVFDVLADEIATRVEELPGPHPFLRKSLRKLVRELG